MRVARAAVVGKGAAVALQGRGARDNRRQRTWEAGIQRRWHAWAANMVKATRGEEDSATATHVSCGSSDSDTHGWRGRTLLALLMVVFLVIMVEEAGFRIGSSAATVASFLRR
ncbi:hypothetical protein OsJ_07619 [Oryza sativa Japonica Group]|uniref:Uncharacterized protein n=1 Tax=Oryza sativa subsp. japonica TaxID=39947 RepID=B9F180_ORYSJ|nr:hypothetical protein OsJ_07619 [Oryza sativa Japonica Group]